jgi:hypothetical protein
MSEQTTLYVMVDYRDPHGHDHVRGDSVVGDMDDALVKELVYRGILSTLAPRREAGTNSARVTGEGSST